MRVFRLAFLGVFGAAIEHDGVSLDYERHSDSNNWENGDAIRNECELTRRPTPMNLESNAECIDGYEMLTREIEETDCKLNSMTFSMTPDKLRAKFPFDDSYCQLPTIDILNGFPATWVAHHIDVRLHADHLLHGCRYDGEMQMFHVYRGSKIDFAAVSILLDASDSDDNIFLQEYIDEWEAAAEVTRNACDGRGGRQLRRKVKVAQPHGAMPRDEFLLLGDQSHEFFDQVEQTVAESSVEQHSRRLVEDIVPREKMFPYNIWPTMDYYGYKNTIKSPPCSEVVAWRVIDKPLVISKRQLSAMARLLSNYQDPITCSKATMTAEKDDDVRALPENQELVHCTPKDFTSQL